jgi:hypothetical protein
MPAEQLKLQSKRRSAILNRSTIGSSKKVNSNNQSPVFQPSTHSFLEKSEIE